MSREPFATVVTPGGVTWWHLVAHGIAPYGDGEERFLDVRLRDGSVKRCFYVNVPTLVYAGDRSRAVAAELARLELPRVRARLVVPHGRTREQAILDARRMRTLRRRRPISLRPLDGACPAV